MKKINTIFIAFLCSFFIETQTSQKINSDYLLSSFEYENKAMGTVSIAENGITTYQNSIGFADLTLKKKANEFTKFRIGSITKTFTATVILQLVDEGKIHLNTLLEEYFPEIPNANVITIEHLLYHRSGLYNITKEDGFHVWVSKPRKRVEMLKKMIFNGVVFEPNTKNEYSNTNYILLSYIAEDIDKKSFAKILQKRIVKPLNLTNTHFGKEINLKKNEATSYYWEDSKWKSITIETNLKGPMGAGAIVSTAKELTVFYTNLFSGKLLSKESLQKMTSPKDEMGMGISIINYKGLLVYGHDGGIDGFRSMAIYIPSKKLAMAFTFNASRVSSTGTIIEILEAYFKGDEKLQSKSLVNLTSTGLDKYLGVYSGKTFPAKVTFTKKGNTLFAQATGQPIFKLIAIEKNVFKYDAMGIVFSFNSNRETVSVKFGGKNHLLSKKN